MCKNILILYKNKQIASLTGYALNAGLGFICTALLARTYTKGILSEWIIFFEGNTLFHMIKSGIINLAYLQYVSGIDDKNIIRNYAGATWIISLSFSFLVTFVIYSTYFLFHPDIEDSGFNMLFKWLPAMIICKLPFDQSSLFLHARQKFTLLAALRVFSVLPFTIFTILNYICFKMNMTLILLAYIFNILIISLVTIMCSWSGINSIFHFKLKYIKNIIDFGKYSVGTFLGLNLLRSSDIFIIKLLLGKEFVALYSIPTRFIMLFEIPLAGFSDTASAEMTSCHKRRESRNYYHTEDFFIFWTSPGHRSFCWNCPG